MRSTIKCCENCTERYVGCHATCEEYIRQKNEFEEKKQKANEIATQRNNVKIARIEGVKRMKTRRKSNLR